MSTHENICLVIDIGGTAIKYGISTLDGTILSRNEMPTEAKLKGGPGIVAKVLDIVESSLASHGKKIVGAAISTAGMVDPQTSKIVYALPDSIPDYTGVNHAALIMEKFNLPCTVENDVNCAALGEIWLGAGKGLDSVFCMTIGTSIGGAMFVNGKLISGNSHSAGEIAYMRVPGGRLHELASATHLVQNYAKLCNIPKEKVNGVLIFDKAEANDATAEAAIDELVDHITDGIVNVVSVQNPQAVILGGGIMARSAYLRPKIASSLKLKLRPIVFASTKIEFAQLRNDAGMLGALFNFKQRIKL